MNLEILSAEVICCIYLLTLLPNVNVETNGVDLEQTVPIGTA